MSKLDIGVGEDFPLDEDRARGSHRHGRHHHHRRFHHHGPRHHHHHHRGLGRLPLLLVLAGLVALIVNHQLTAPIAYGMIGVGAALLLLTALVHAAWHWRHRRGLHTSGTA